MSGSHLNEVFDRHFFRETDNPVVGFMNLQDKGGIFIDRPFVIKKMGFEIEGTKRDSLRVDGVYVDEYYMAKLLTE